jgi:hypothetical protein
MPCAFSDLGCNGTDRTFVSSEGDERGQVFVKFPQELVDCKTGVVLNAMQLHDPFEPVYFGRDEAVSSVDLSKMT